MAQADFIYGNPVLTRVQVQRLIDCAEEALKNHSLECTDEQCELAEALKALKVARDQRILDDLPMRWSLTPSMG